MRLAENRRGVVAIIVGAVLIAVVAVVLTLVATSGSSAPTSTTTPKFVFAHNARSDVAPGTCVAENGGWTYSGTVHNSKSVSRDYQIVIDYITVPGDTVMSTETLELNGVGAGQTVDWTSHGANGLSNINCVVRFAQAVPSS